MWALLLIGRWEAGARGFCKRGRERAHRLSRWAANVVWDYHGRRKGGDLKVEGGETGEVLDGNDEATELGFDGNKAEGTHGGLLWAREGLGEGVNAVAHLVVVGGIGAEEAEDAIRRENAEYGVDGPEQREAVLVRPVHGNLLAARCVRPGLARHSPPLHHLPTDSHTTGGAQEDVHHQRLAGGQLVQAVCRLGRRRRVMEREMEPPVPPPERRRRGGGGGERARRAHGEDGVEHLEVELLHHQLRARAHAPTGVGHPGHCRRHRTKTAPAPADPSSSLKLWSKLLPRGMAGARGSKTA